MHQVNIENMLAYPFISSVGQGQKNTPEKASFLDSIVVADSFYTVKIIRNKRQINELLRLRYRVFNVELGNAPADSFGLEQDEFDPTSLHLVAIENETGKIIGGYRLRTAEMPDFYAAKEFRINDLPNNILRQAVEIGRACIAPEHRNGKVLFLLWKGLAQYLQAAKKRYLFGCCSIFSRDLRVGQRAFYQLEKGGFLHEQLRVTALKPLVAQDFDDSVEEIELPKFFKTYLRIGAKVCSPPMVDTEFGTIDFFVIFDSQKINEKYRRMFFG